MAKRPASKAEVPPAKRQESRNSKIGTSKDSRITPTSKPGSYRLISNLKTSITNADGLEHWPGVICDQEMIDCMLMGQKQPRSAKEAHEYPGYFTESKIKENSKIFPVYLIGKNLAMWVPAGCMSILDRSALENLQKHEDESEEFRAALNLVAVEHPIQYWKDRMRGMPFVADWEDPEQAVGNGNDSMDDERLAALCMPCNTEKTSDDQPMQFKKSPSSVSLPLDASELMFSSQLARAASVDCNILCGDHREPIIVPTKANVDVPDALSTLEAADSNGPLPSTSVKTESESIANIAKQGRASLRKAKAGRVAGNDEVRVAIGPNGDEFIIKRTGLMQSPYLANKIEFDEYDRQFHITTHKLARIDADDFEAAADFMNKGDFRPFIFRSRDGTLGLKNFDPEDKERVAQLVARCSSLCSIASQLGAAQLRNIAIAKFKLLAPYQQSGFVGFLQTMRDQEYCKDEALKVWLIEYSHEHYYELLDQGTQFSHFLQQSADFALPVHRLLAGLPAQPEQSKKRKKAGEKASTPAAAPEPAKASKAAGGKAATKGTVGTVVTAKKGPATAPAPKKAAHANGSSKTALPPKAAPTKNSVESKKAKGKMQARLIGRAPVAKMAAAAEDDIGESDDDEVEEMSEDGNDDGEEETLADREDD